MQVADLGEMAGPVLLFGGPYSNLQATRALMNRAASLGIEPAMAICTGDTVAYCADPAATAQCLRTWGCHVVAGNCERQLASGAADCGCGFEAGTVCDTLSGTWFSFAAQRVDQDVKNWMGDLPDLAVFTHQGQRYGVLHGGVGDVAKFLWSTSDEAALLAEWDAFERLAGHVDHLIAGHSGIAFVRETARGRWINAGVIGMPPHGGTQQTEFAVLDGGAVTLHRLTYNAQAAATAMQAAGLPTGYRRGLLTGYWPSEDVLPAALRASGLASG